MNKINEDINKVLGERRQALIRSILKHVCSREQPKKKKCELRKELSQYAEKEFDDVWDNMWQMGTIKPGRDSIGCRDCNPSGLYTCTFDYCG